MSTVRLPPILYTNQRSITFPVSNQLINRLGGSSFRVSFETQSASGALLRRSGSYQVQVVAPPPLVRDFTPFNDYLFNGWSPGPATLSPASSPDGYGLYDYPIVSLATNQGPLTPAVFLTSMWPNFVTISGVFTANSSTVECQFVSHQASGVGNDYRSRILILFACSH